MKVLVGNKIDLKDDRDVSEEQGQHLAKEYGINYWEASAKSNIKIKECVEDVIEAVIANK